MTVALQESFGIQFEEDYIHRNYRSITSTPDIALTEFVANAWDAGAYNVSISIPEQNDKEPVISIEDDGIGMTDEEFSRRWMTLNYDRQKKQGKMVSFPDDVDDYNRFAYGHNGVGRHGMFCFNNHYTIETWKNGLCNKYDIALSCGNQPFKIVKHENYKKEGHGTKISTSICRNMPDSNKMIDIISARFLYDPRFAVSINNITVKLEEQRNIQSQKDIEINVLNLHITVIDSTKTAVNTQQNGIAFWVCNRLVGQPAWTINNYQFLDGRCKAAKRYTIIIQTDDMMDDVMPDWTGFINSDNMKQFLIDLRPHINKIINMIMEEQINDVQQTVIKETWDELEKLTPYEQRGVSTFIEVVTESNPIINPDFLKNAVEAVIIMEQSKSGEKLLSQLCKLSSDDMDRLSDLLETWNVNDILTVMNEIDRRLTIIEAISRTCNDKTTDELHTLHPLILSSRWLFGAEFDSPMFASNKTLNTVISTLFKDKNYDEKQVTNSRKRPDIVLLDDGTFNAVCTDRIDTNAGGIMKPDQILIIELKRGGFEIEYNEVQQAMNYMRQIKKSGVLHKNSSIHAFVVGATIGDIDTRQENTSGILDVLTYSQLVETAKIKLFRLKEQLSEHYDSIDDKSLVEKALNTQKQLSFNNIK